MAIDYTKRPKASTPPQAPPVNLSKISLTKDAPRISLSKDGAQQGVMRVNLNWSANAQGVDLDLGCLYELSDGSKSVIQALGNRYGSENSPPFILLDGDDRSGSNTSGENMRINLAQPERFRRILIFAMIYSGAANWAAVDGVVTMYPTVGAPIEVRLDSAVEGARICAIAQVYYAEGGIHVSREVRYINGSQRDLDAAYGWGMQWTTGSKD